MYEENLNPLREGDFSRVFAEPLQAIAKACKVIPPKHISPTHVLHWAERAVQPHLARICRRLLLPGSGIVGAEHLAELNRLAGEGHPCIVCLNHRSNLDVPTMYALLQDQGCEDLFHRIIWMAGRKLHEDTDPTRVLVQAFNQVIVTPRSWMKDKHSEQELHEANQINIAAHRAIHDLRGQGWVFGLFPAATRLRPGDEATAHAIEETDSYLKHFDYLLLGRIDGCTLPVTRDRDLTHEVPTLDRMRYSFAPVQCTEEWRSSASRRHADVDQKTASALAIIEDIEAIPTDRFR